MWQGENMKNTNRVQECGEYIDAQGIEAAMANYGISRETARRYSRGYREDQGTTNTEKFNRESNVIKQLKDRFTVQELESIANGKAINPDQQNIPVINFDGDDVRIGFCTDTHIGSKYFPKHYWESFLEECYKTNVNMIIHSGDLIEGMSNRPDQIYSLTHVGYSAQMDYAAELLKMTDLPIKIIDGNHDRWGIKSGGVFAVKDIAARLGHVEFIGHDQGIIDINGTTWMPWHGEDSGSFATSYRLQKLIEAFTGGTKPQVILAGHTHKQGYFFERNIHAVTGGALSMQSAWMRGKRLANHDGFHIIRATIADKEIKSFSPTWYPFYN
jgi:predicted phosphodiesterase